MDEFYGIDLGTTNSCIAIIDEDDQVVVVTNYEGQLTTPSVVAYDEKNEPYVGAAAKANMGNDPERTVAFIKREMSSNSYSRKIGSIDINPIDVSAQVLKKLVGDANQKRMDEEGKDPITKVVITVPAYFGNTERERTLEAGKRAGLDVISLINEPTAAALSFGKKNKQNRTVLVYDLGGGTFDVSIMRIENGVMDTLATNGNHHLGGADWDEAIVNYILMKEGLNITCDDLDPQEKGALLLAAEAAKIILSTKDETTIRFAYKGIHNTPITKEELEDLTVDLLDQTSKLVDDAIQMAGNPKIDDVLLVGGSSRMKMVKNLIESKFNLTPKLFEPDLAVAKGAALFAAQEEKGYTKGAIQLGKDKGSTSYGIESYINGVARCSNLIKISDDLEVSKKFDTFSTMEDKQTCILLKVYQGRSDDDDCDLAKCDLLDEHPLEWGTPVPKGTPMIVTVNRGKDGVIKVWAGAVGHEVEFLIGVKGIQKS